MILFYREMNAILNLLHKRIFNFEIALQANNRSQEVIDKVLSTTSKTNRMMTQEVISNSIETLSTRYSSDVPLEKFNISSVESIAIRLTIKKRSTSLSRCPIFSQSNENSCL
jgi:hypothetical protein